jgi:hypothetical protein
MMATRLRQMLEGPLLLADDTGLMPDARPKRSANDPVAAHEPTFLPRAPGGPGTPRVAPGSSAGGWRTSSALSTER